MPEWPEAAEEPERRQLLAVAARVRPVPPRAGAQRDPVEPPHRDAPPPARRDPRCAAGRERRSRRHRPPRRGRRCRGTASPSTRSSPPAERQRSNRTARRTRTTAAPPTSSTGSRAPEQGAVLEEYATAAYLVVPPRRGRSRRSSGRSRSTASSGDVEAVGRCTRALSRFHWYVGDGEAAWAKGVEAIAILEPLGESAELARAYSGVSQLAMLAEDPDEARKWGEQALELATRMGDESTRAHALVNIGSAMIMRDRGETEMLLEAHADRRRRGRPPRGDPRAREPRFHAHVVDGSRVRARVRAAGARLRAGARGAQPRVVLRDDGRLAAAAGGRVGRGGAGHAGRDRAGDHRGPAPRQDGPRRAGRSPGRSGCRRAAGRRRGAGGVHRESRSASRRSSSCVPSGR